MSRLRIVSNRLPVTVSVDDGVLVHGEFVGAAAELGEALCVNPYHVDGRAATCHRALTMPPEERHARMRAPRVRVHTYDVRAWADSLLAALDGADPAQVDR